MPSYILDTAFEVEQAEGVAAHRIVTLGSRAGLCVLPGGANAGRVLGVTVDAAPKGRAVAVRRLGRALIEAAGVIPVGSPVCVADSQGRIQAAVRATGLTGSTGANNAIRWTAVPAGALGNTVSVEIVVAGNDTSLSVAVVGNKVTVNSATDGSGVATTTAALAMAAVSAHSAASRLVEAVGETPSSGAAAVAAASLALSGGEGGLHALGTAETAATQAGDLIDVFLVP